MKNSISKMAIGLLFLGSSIFIACGGNSGTHGEAKEYSSEYVCPMHCEGSGSDEAGTCPVCGMDYVPHAEHVKDGHQH